MSETTGSPDGTDDPDVPEWDDEYFDKVSDRLMYNYDLEKDYEVRGERFSLYGEMRMASQKHFFHPSIRFGYHESTEHVFARRTDHVVIPDLEHYIALGKELADAWIEPDEQHFSTEFTFVSVTNHIDDSVRQFIENHRERTLIKYGYYGHYEIHLIVVAPGAEDIVASEEANVEAAFRLWDPIEREEPGLLGLITRRLQL